MSVKGFIFEGPRSQKKEVQFFVIPAIVIIINEGGDYCGRAD